MTETSGQGTNTCPKCGAQFPAVSAKFCPVCGQNLSATEAPAWAAPIAPIAPAAPAPEPVVPPIPPSAPVAFAPAAPIAEPAPGYAAPPPPPPPAPVYPPAYGQAPAAPHPPAAPLPPPPPTYWQPPAAPQPPTYWQPPASGSIPGYAAGYGVTATPARRNPWIILLAVASIVLVLVLLAGTIVVFSSGGSTLTALPSVAAVETSAAPAPTTTTAAVTVSASPTTEVITLPVADYTGMTVAFIQTGSESGWRGANTASFVDTAVADGITLKVYKSNNDFNNQIKAFNQFIADSTVQVIVLAAVDYQGYDTVLKSAKAAGKVVIIEDRAINSSPSLYYTYIGSDFAAEGEKGAAAMCTLLNGMKGAYVLEIAGAAGSDAATDRAKGFRNNMGDCGITITASRDAQWDQTMAYNATALYLKSNKDIQGVLAHNDDMAIGAIKAIKAAGLKPGPDVKVVSFDATSNGFKALISGELGADIECSPDIAPQAYKAAWDALHGVTASSSWIPTQEGQFFASQGPSALQAIFETRKY